MDLILPSVTIDLEGDDHYARGGTISRRSQPSNQGGIRIPPPVSGVEEGRNVDRLLSSARGSETIDSQRREQRPSRGQTREQPVVLDDDSQMSTSHALNGKMDLITALDNSLADELSEINNGKKRQGSYNTGTESHFFKGPKRPKTISEFVDESDQEVMEVTHQPTDGVGRNRRTSQEPQILSKTFKGDNGASRPRPSSCSQAGDSEDMTDELAQTPERAQIPRKVPIRAERSYSKDRILEIAESPPPKDDYLSSAEIQPTPFRHPEKASSKARKGVAKQNSKALRKDIYPLDYYRDPLNNIRSPGLQLWVDDSEDGFFLSFYDRSAIASMDPAKVKAVHWSPDRSNLVRVQGVRDSASGCIMTWDLDFKDHQVLKNFILRLKKMTPVTLHTRTPYDHPTHPCSFF
jgi:hypothetical protein